MGWLRPAHLSAVPQHSAEVDQPPCLTIWLHHQDQTDIEKLGMDGSNDIRTVLTELGLSEYISTFLLHGFDDWATVCAIKEDDFDFLKVKLGHRRKLQRAISGSLSDARQPPNPPSTSSDHTRSASSLFPLAGTPSSVDQSQDNRSRPKRKYRRHPKPDSHAPLRPPSAYVLFSNHVRQSLQGQAVDFTTMAKTVGHRWQVLPAAERESFEDEASRSKERYNVQLTHYRKTQQFGEYQQYLKDFKREQDNKRARTAGGSPSAMDLDQARSRSGSEESKISYRPPKLLPSGSSNSLSPRSPTTRLPPLYAQDHRGSNNSLPARDWGPTTAGQPLPGIQESALDPYRQASRHFAARGPASSTTSNSLHPYSSFQSSSQDGSTSAPMDHYEDHRHPGTNPYGSRDIFKAPGAPASEYGPNVPHRLPPLQHSSSGSYSPSNPSPFYSDRESDGRFPRDMSHRRTRPDSAQVPPYFQTASTSSTSSHSFLRNESDAPLPKAVHSRVHGERPGSPHTGRMIDGSLTPPPQPAKAMEANPEQWPVENSRSRAQGSREWLAKHSQAEALLDPGEMSYPKPKVSELRSKRSPRGENPN